ncbi:MAG: hypothetical protein AAGF73_03150 [Actinomycetota bacterium]
MKTAFGTMVLLPLGFAVAGAYIWATAPAQGKLLGMIWTVVGVALLAFFAILVLVLGRKRARTLAVREHGIAATAVITEMSDTGMQVNYQPQMQIGLEVHVPGVAPYRHSMRKVVPLSMLGQLRPGATIAVHVAADDPHTVVMEEPSRLLVAG